jgi:hypothetical protein
VTNEKQQRSQPMRPCLTLWGSLSFPAQPRDTRIPLSTLHHLIPSPYLQDKVSCRHEMPGLIRGLKDSYLTCFASELDPWRPPPLHSRLEWMGYHLDLDAGAPMMPRISG